MAINKLNFGAAGSNLGYKSGIGALSDRLMQFGSDLNESERIKLEQKKQEEDRQYRLSRDALADERYNKQEAERLSDKFDARQKEIATNEALGLIGDEKGFLAGKISAENKAYADALAGVSDPVERARLQSDIAQYQQSGTQGSEWKNAIMSNTNIDQKAVGSLQRELDRDAEANRRFNLQLAETRATRNEASKERADARRREEQRLADTYGVKTIESGSLKSVPWGQYGAIGSSKNIKTGNKIFKDIGQEGYDYQSSLYNKDVAPIANKIEEIGSKLLTGNEAKDNETIINEWRKYNQEKKNYIDQTSGLDEFYNPKDERYTIDNFTDFRNKLISDNDKNQKEYSNLQEKLNKTIDDVNQKVTNKFGSDEVKTENKYISSEEAGNIAADYAKTEAIRLGLSADAANYAINNAYQTAYNENEKLKSAGTKLMQDKTQKEQEKTYKASEKQITDIQDQIKSLNSLSEKFSGTKEDSVYYKGKEKDKDDAQKEIEKEIEEKQRELSTLQRQLYPSVYK